MIDWGDELVAFDEDEIMPDSDDEVDEEEEEEGDIVVLSCCAWSALDDEEAPRRATGEGRFEAVEFRLAASKRGGTSAGPCSGIGIIARSLLYVAAPVVNDCEGGASVDSS